MPPPHIVAGHAGRERHALRGWFIGPFIDVSALHSAAGVEVKWGVHDAGEIRGAWGHSDWVTLSVLVSGRFRLQFETEEHVLSEPGEYVLWSPGVIHTWVAESACVVLTVRWPMNEPA